MKDNGNDTSDSTGSRRRRTPRSPQKLIQPVSAPRPRSRHARNPLVLVLNFILTALLVIALGVGGIVYWGKSAYESPGPLTAATTVLIPPGSNLDDIAGLLEDGKVITNRWIFEAAAKVYRTTGEMKAGEYAFAPGVTMAQVMDEIVAGRSIQRTMTIPEGVTSAQVVDKLTADAFLMGTIDSIPPEGSLLPETYNFTRGTPRRQLLDRMEKAQTKLLAEAWAGREPGLPLESSRDLVILASIVEKETGKPEERPMVAAVFINRLKKGMKLQSDPTIIYGLFGGASWKQARTILKTDLTRPNPYNTYQIKGLPPGPIGNPGKDSIEAVAHPAKTDALYFVADGSGGHVFSSSLDEHNRNVARWRQIEQNRANAPDDDETQSVQPATPAN
ncbi:endolytic transglycosylase MltG [Segnochrobactrum spirostomi]|uniref:Endolytic murein transglycosylase n=1 Tax=Segnochrobactrum spirostomi TaxID=2608987 RepID=A0A6A7XXB7_9HYPH|nr:endolytic transglycosylase MltG [Segnochrobactrum spirostomi]MQT11250.1 endolytic transglycosylase MltG [Segnochrobactrum spirostomi]